MTAEIHFYRKLAQRCLDDIQQSAAQFSSVSDLDIDPLFAEIKKLGMSLILDEIDENAPPRIHVGNAP